jgi:5-(hydroxymethyl)furfural/furfural oxidase
MHDPRHQAEWQWPGLMTRRTRAQEPKFYWRGRTMGGSSTVNAQIAIRGVPAGLRRHGRPSAAPAGRPPTSCPSSTPSRTTPSPARAPAPAAAARSPSTARPSPNGAASTARSAPPPSRPDYPWKEDLNAPAGEGVSCYPINSRDGLRVTTNDGYLEPARGRPNLTIRGERPRRPRAVRRPPRHRRAPAHRFDGGNVEDIAAREVVLSAGAIHSPAILMRSGIGPAADLAALGIRPPRTTSPPSAAASWTTRSCAPASPSPPRPRRSTRTPATPIAASPIPRASPAAASAT